MVRGMVRGRVRVRDRIRVTVRAREVEMSIIVREVQHRVPANHAPGLPLQLDGQLGEAGCGQAGVAHMVLGLELLHCSDGQAVLWLVVHAHHRLVRHHGACVRAQARDQAGYIHHIGDSENTVVLRVTGGRTEEEVLVPCVSGKRFVVLAARLINISKYSS